ncbi:hypothetical protein BC828DRAFT_145581 [Blastocladiella britannica]|nr:hypothetical protein BC828DRAFT_145581 [Blastocladiella britannica]
MTAATTTDIETPAAAAVTTTTAPATAKPWHARVRDSATYRAGQPAYDLVTSPWMSARMLLAVRVVLALWMATWWTIEVFVTNGSGIAIFSYFTVLSYSGILILSVTLAFLSYAYSRDPEAQALASATGVHTAVTYLFATASTNCLIVSPVYWLFLAPQYGVPSIQTADGLTNLSVHALNVAVMLIHWLTSSLVIGTWWLLVPVITTGVLYLIWALMWHAINGKWVYGFLNPADKSSTYMYPAVIAAFFIMFAVVKGLLVLRTRVLGVSSVHAVRTQGQQSGKPAAVVVVA